MSCIIVLVSFLFLGCEGSENQSSAEIDGGHVPNVLLAISDDQSWPHAGAYGAEWIRTPGFDRVAREGVLFSQGFVTSPGCAPSRGSMVLGRYPWQNEHAGNHNSLWPAKFETLTDSLGKAGFHVGYTGKGVGPFWWALGGRYSNPAGPEYNQYKVEPPYQNLSSIDYAGNFEAFLQDREEGRPFFFWYGASEPHRRYDLEAARASGSTISSDFVPSFLPDTEGVREDLLAYAKEIEWFDQHLTRMLGMLERAGELENTLVIVTSDNGMPFPAAKANVYEYGIHVPLAISWPERIPNGRKVDDLVSLVDLAPTLLELLGEEWRPSFSMSGRSFANLLLSNEEGVLDEARSEVLAGRERHSSSRWENLGYPQRAIRTQDYLYIRNFEPMRWPTGAPEKFDSEGDRVAAFHDLDWGSDWGFTNRFFVQQWNRMERNGFIGHALEKRPAEELFDIRDDPGCLNNLASHLEYQDIKARLAKRLETRLRETGDPRVVGLDPNVFETYPRLAAIRRFPRPDWADRIGAEELASLVEKVGSDYSPLTRPDEIGESSMEAGSWRIERDSEGIWHLYNWENDPDSQVDLSQMKPKLMNQLLSVYEFDWDSK